MTFVHRVLSISTQRHCTINHCKREISKTQMNESACFVLNRRLSLTIVNVVFHQLSLSAKILSLFCVVNKIVMFRALASWSLHLCVQPSKHWKPWNTHFSLLLKMIKSKQGVPTCLVGSLFMSYTNIVPIDNIFQLEKSIQTASRKKLTSSNSS